MELHNAEGMKWLSPVRNDSPDPWEVRKESVRNGRVVKSESGSSLVDNNKPFNSENIKYKNHNLLKNLVAKMVNEWQNCNDHSNNYAMKMATNMKSLVAIGNI